MSICRLSRLATLALSLVGSSLIAPARANTWGPSVVLGTMQLESDPSCASDGAGLAVCAAVGPDSQVYFNSWTGTAWTDWLSVENIVGIGAPSCASVNPGDYICVFQTPNLKLAAFEAVTSGGTGFGLTFATVDVAFGSAPSCAAVGPSGMGELLCAGRGLGGDLIGAFYSGGGLSGNWTPFTAPSAVDSPVGCAPDSLGNAVCAWRTTASAVSARLFDGGTATSSPAWSPEAALGGLSSNPPVCTGSNSNGQGVVSCFVTNNDSSLYINAFYGLTQNPFNAAGWSGWNNLEGLVHGYSCAGVGSPTAYYACAVTGLKNTGLWTTDVTVSGGGAAGSGWVSQGTGVFIGSPSCFVISAADMLSMCVATEVNGRAISIVGN